jgi:hypothetical protein
MSNSTAANNRRFRLRLPPAEAQVALGLTAALLNLCVVQFADFGLLHILLVVVFFAIGLLGQRAWAIYLMLAVITFLLYFLGVSFFKTELSKLRLSDLQAAFVLMMLAGACFRHLETGRYLKVFHPDVELGQTSESSPGFEFPSLLGGRWWAIPMSIFLAFVLLSIFPFEKQMLRNLEIKPFAHRVIFLTLFLFFGWFVCRALVEMIVRLRMDACQADVHCRSLIAKEMWQDSYPIEKRMGKLRSRE